MKKFMTAIACMLLFTGCGTIVGSASLTADEEAALKTEDQTEADAETGTAVVVDAGSLTTQPLSELTTDPSENENGGFTFKVENDGIEVSRDGAHVQKIELSCGHLVDQDNIAPENCLMHEDFDFDGNKDLFVPTQTGTQNLPGKYFRFDKSSGEFIEWDVLNEVGMAVIADQEAETLTEYSHISASDSQYKTFRWNDVELELVRRIESYAKDGNVIVDTYEYSDGQERLISSEKTTVSEETA